MGEVCSGYQLSCMWRWIHTYGLTDLMVGPNKQFLLVAENQRSSGKTIIAAIFLNTTNSVGYLQLSRKLSRTDEMTEWVKARAAKPDNPNSVSVTHMEGEN